MFPVNTRILIVDDSRTIRELVKNQLKQLGYSSFCEVSDGDQALQMLEKNHALRTPIQLIISDWNMPNMSGLDLLRQVRASADWPKVPFVLLTAETEREQVADAISAGVSQYILKPFTPKILEEKLKSVWAKLNPRK